MRGVPLKLPDSRSTSTKNAVGAQHVALQHPDNESSPGFRITCFVEPSEKVFQDYVAKCSWNGREYADDAAKMRGYDGAMSTEARDLLPLQREFVRNPMTKLTVPWSETMRLAKALLVRSHRSEEDY